jgi:uncharacterized protein
MKRKCPICQKPVERTLPGGEPNKYFPFCCQRCQLLDMGVWLDAGYRVPQDPEEADATDATDEQ